MQSIKLGILASNRGTHLAALLEKTRQKTLDAEITVVISNKENALVLERAREHAVPPIFVDPALFSKEDYDQKLSEIFHHYQVDLIVLIGYMKILTGKFISHWQHKIINVHPSLLPLFAGKMDLQVHQAVLDAGVNETGCTVHYVTEEVDAGPILIQKKCPVFQNDTAEILKARVQQLEAQALCEAISTIQTYSKVTA